jgi:hypothetical protein
MSCFLYLNDEESSHKINIDDLYENKKKRDLKQVAIFNKILNRVHKRILITGRNKKNEQHIWFVIPEYIFGEPVYDKAECIAYIIAKLEVNKFHIKYLHPNTLFISWANFIPSYVRTEYKKKTGILVDENGIIVDKQELDNNIMGSNELDSKILNNRTAPTNVKVQKEYTPIKNYKPTGHLIYNPDLFEKIEKKIN